MDPADVGRTLGQRHQQGEQPEPYDPSLSLLNYAEVPYQDDWTLRSALVRLAQPEPARVGSLLTLARRLDAPLHHVKRTLERQLATCSRADEPYTDIRTADLARLVADGLDIQELMAGYEQLVRLEREEQMAVPLLAIAARLERLAEELTAWARVGPESPPVDAVDQAVSYMGAELDRLNVPEETGFR